MLVVSLNFSSIFHRSVVITVIHRTKFWLGFRHWNKWSWCDHHACEFWFWLVEGIFYARGRKSVFTVLSACRTSHLVLSTTPWAWPVCGPRWGETRERWFYNKARRSLEITSGRDVCFISKAACMGISKGIRGSWDPIGSQQRNFSLLCVWRIGGSKHLLRRRKEQKENNQNNDDHLTTVSVIMLSLSAVLSRVFISQVETQDKKKKLSGRAKRRMQYNRRFVNVATTFGGKRGPNSNLLWRQQRPMGLWQLIHCCNILTVLLLAP